VASKFPPKSTLFVAIRKSTLLKIKSSNNWRSEGKYCTMFGSLLDQFCTNCTRYSTEDAVRIDNSFITIPIARNYNHSQLFLTLLRVYTIIILTRSWLKSLITLLHWLTSQLSITVSHYRTLYILTLQNSRRDLTPRIHLLILLLNNSLVELLLNHWLLHSHSGNCFLRTALVELLPRTTNLDISVPLINPQSY
jgi:hypothetical protein